MTWWQRIFRQRALERDLDAELRDHIEREVAEGVRAGESEADVRRQIRLTSGGLDQVKEQCRDVRRPPALAGLGADLRFAWRILAKDRWFTAGAIVTLALAMGAANTTFISTYAVFARDLPIECPDRVAIVRTLDARGREAGVSYPEFEDYRREARVFDGEAAAFAGGTISLGRDGALPEQFDGLYLSANTFSVLRAKPLLGRDFSPDDDRPGAEAVVIIGSNIWKSRYGGGGDVLGRKVTVNGTIPATIVGVMPDGFHFVDFTDVWLPLSQMIASTRQRRDARALYMYGRLRDGTSYDAVRTRLSAIAATLAVTYPDTNKDVRLLVNTFREAYNAGLGSLDALTQTPVLAAAFVLLIAAANLANLLLARAASRSREIAIRMSIGATRWRIVRQLLIESALLSLAAWIAAVAVSWFALKVTAPIDPQLPYWRLKMDGRLLGILAAIALVTTGLFSLAPALYASRRGTADGLKEGGRLSAGPKTRRWTNALLVGQFAVTLALLYATGLTARLFFASLALDRTVQRSDAVTTFMRLPPQKYATPDQRVAFHEHLRARLMAIPGMTASAIASTPPFSFVGGRALVAVDGRPTSDPPPGVATIVVDAAYFRTVASGLILGESFSALDGTPGHETAVVNQRFADVYLGGGSPIGRHLQLRGPRLRPLTFNAALESPQSAPPVPVTVVAVAPNIRQGRDDGEPIVYLPFRAEVPTGITLIVRGTGGPARLVAAARGAANAIDPDLALGAVRTFDDLRERSRSFLTERTSQFTRVGVLALLLSALGLYSALAYAVKRRTQEVAIRMALGAQAAHVRWLFLRTGVWVVGGGLVLGVPGAIAAGRMLQSGVFGLNASDLVTLGVTIAVLAAVALVASIVPAQRATRLEPTVALRLE
jgi:predicted permease